MAKEIVICGKKVFESDKGTSKTGKGYDGCIYSKYGTIEYIVFPKVRTIVFNGSFIHPEYRGKGIYKKLVKRLLTKWNGWAFHCLAINPKVVSTLTKRFGFKVTSNPLYYWGIAKGEKGEKGCRLKRGRYTRKGTEIKSG